MKAIYSLILVVALILIAMVGAGALGMGALFGVIIPYLAVLVFIVGFVVRVVQWGKTPVPFRIPTTCGQARKSLPMFKDKWNRLDNPGTKLGVVGRMFFEVFLFRSLFRNTRVELHQGPHIAYSSSKWLWIFALIFHYTFLVIFLRHMRFFTEPVPELFVTMDHMDSMFQILSPALYLSSALILVALGYLLLRRLLVPSVRYISQPADYFPLFLILGIVISGMLMRYIGPFKTDLMAVKELTMGLVQFSPTVPDGIGATFFVHLFLVSVLLVYFPFSKLMHLGGVFLSPTRNLPNDSREKHHENPWNYPVKFHTYQAYEDENREVMVEAGLPVEKPLEEKTEEASGDETSDDNAEKKE
ncbi:sulfate reduction electron transfer complex DsrMKJOP subunit DsrM [Desulfonatronospira sp. MSAO_Bac3]|uniref:sulfate reduction electron transfer complex DsrMKJOP subunit DsrM n=1 Tax=Desulfonatronospira sp. MSAO_Bac3 TaxID=2293857 RepID=UPI000FEF2D61|nr:sulfate reduction electron transfer complex DsrMKJOP subunit DsrM [Desulfonatronospira sp. MSAO_Bac3]RQD75542.1 MAG: menaquinol oxidoreductase [Desulfonatronospira sp. MSAO_Bac3]